jgi:hypothetical protein
MPVMGELYLYCLLGRDVVRCGKKITNVSDESAAAFFMEEK